jgi:hypothetical protein
MEGAHIPVSYKLSWDDGYGVRGWKLDCSIGESSVIAATAETGNQITTSVLVHDILDHYLCGVGIGGHKNEAIALVQMAVRTGVDPTPDFRQIIEEDILVGRVNGDSMYDFLPEWLTKLVPPEIRGDLPIIRKLQELLGKKSLREALLDHFLALGVKGAYQARKNFEKEGLIYSHRSQMGYCLQSILRNVDDTVVTAGIDSTTGIFYVANDTCSLALSEPSINFTSPL